MNELRQMDEIDLAGFNYNREAIEYCSEETGLSIEQIVRFINNTNIDIMKVATNLNQYSFNGIKNAVNLQAEVLR